MCRIAGILDRNSPTIKEDIVAMRDAMQHGGPDGEGVYLDESVSLALGHRRLSLIDLSHQADQPMSDPESKIILVFNGEIYNYLELKAELAGLGYAFRTTSDTEVIINGYKHWGEMCFERLKGMFAIALYDKDKQALILARDHVGIKPLYYSLVKGSVYFASEVKAFSVLKKEWEANSNWQIFFLTYGYLPEPVTTLKDVRPLESGSYLKINVETLACEHHTFYNSSFSSAIVDVETAKKVIKETLTKAVKRHLISDAPIGLFLSGGIDSSLLTLLAKEYKHDDLHTLSIVFNDKNYSEKQYQDIVVKKAKSNHQYFTLTKDIFLEGLDDYMRAMDQPSADGINTYFISKYAKQSGLKAVLSGLGADELLGGYASFRLNRMVSASRIIPGVFYRMAEYLPDYRYKKISFLQRKDIVGEYLFNRGYFSPIQTAQILDIDISEVNKLLATIQLEDAANVLKNGNKVSAFESQLYMKSQLLKDTDIMSMWHSIEVRVPFLDIDFIRAIHSISNEIKFGNKQGKYLLIETFKDILPAEIWNRKKQGFVFPFRKWIEENEYKTPQCRSQELYSSFRSGKLDWSRFWTYLISDTYRLSA